MPDYEVVPASRKIISSDIEESVFYERTDGIRVDLAAAFLDIQDPLLMLAIYQKDDELGNPTLSMELTMEEARLLRDLLTRPAVAAILDESEEDKHARPAGFTKEYLDQLAAQIADESRG